MKTNVDEGYVSIAGNKIWYKIFDSGSSGIPLVAVHGGPGATHDYLLPLNALADERPVIFYDQLDCGNSDRPGDISKWTIEYFVSELGELCSALNLTKYHLLGQSWGGTLAVEFALSKNSEGLKRLILSAPLISTPRWFEDQRGYVNQLPQDMRETINRCEAAEDYSNPEYQLAIAEFYSRHLCRIQPYPEPLMKTFEKMNGAIYAHMWGPSEFTVNGTCKDYDASDRLSSIKIPVLFTCGEFDEATPASLNYFAGLMTSASVHIFSDASHSHHLEKPDEFIDVVRKFLQ